MIDTIKKLQSDWYPMSLDKNPFANYTKDDFNGLVSS